MKITRTTIILLPTLLLLIIFGFFIFWRTGTTSQPTSNIPTPTPVTPIIKVTNEETNVDLNVLILEYYPDTDQNGVIDDIAGGDVRGQTIQSLKTKVSNLNTQAVEKLTAATKYKGYKQNSQPYINYKIIDTKIFDKAVPISTQFKPFADHLQILQNDIDVCNYVEQQNIKEIWIWMYHSAAVVPIESNMASNLGDISNSHRQNDLPICNKTYTVYNYNYGRGLGEVIEDHTHQLEALFNWVDGRDSTPAAQWTQLLFWGKFVGSDSTNKIVNPGCGWTHYPPNGIKDYDWTNTTNVMSDCLDWNPARSGTKSNISCSTWGCNNDGGVNFKVWWMQNIPGYQNQLEYNGKELRNWWEFKADFDLAVQKGKSLVTSQDIASPTPTPDVTPIISPTPQPTASPIPTITPVLEANIDLNSDGNVNISDFVLFAQYYKTSDCRADLDKDTACRDIDDFSIFVEKYKSSR